MKHSLLILILPLVFAGTARAEALVEASPLPTIKVLGRGIADRETGQTLQVACVGAPIQKDSSERSCDTLQFFAFDPRTQKAELVGYPIRQVKGNEARERIKQALKDMRIDPHNGRAWTGFYAVTAFIGVSAFVFPPGPILYAWLGVGVFASMVTIPKALVSNAMGVKSAAELQSRAVSAWQLRPKKIRSKRFQKIMTRFYAYSSPTSLEEGLRVVASRTDAQFDDLAVATPDDLDRISQLPPEEMAGLAEELAEPDDAE